MTITPMDWRFPVVGFVSAIASFGLSFLVLGKTDTADRVATLETKERADAALLAKVTQLSERMSDLAGSDFARIDGSLDRAGITHANWWCSAKKGGGRVYYRTEAKCTDIAGPGCGPEPIAYCSPPARGDKEFVCFDSLATCNIIAPVCIGIE